MFDPSLQKQAIMGEVVVKNEQLKKGAGSSFSMSTSAVSTMTLMHSRIYYTVSISLLSPLNTLELLSVPL